MVIERRHRGIIGKEKVKKREGGNPRGEKRKKKRVGKKRPARIKTVKRSKQLGLFGKKTEESGAGRV